MRGRGSDVCHERTHRTLTGRTLLPRSARWSNSYQNSRGGPSLAGVFAGHSGPGLAVVLAVRTR